MNTILLALWTMTGLADAKPGGHIRAGQLEITPDIDVGAEVRSNVYRQEEGGPSAANLLVSPGIRVQADGRDHAFTTGFDWRLRKFVFVGAGDAPTGPVEGRVRRLDRFNEYNGTLTVDTFRRSVVGFRVDDQIGYQNWTADAEFADVPYTSHFRNALRGGLRLDPASALQISVLGQWAFDRYFAPAIGERDGAFNQRHAAGPRLEARWAFLPRTSIVLEGEYALHRWQNNALQSNPEVPGAVISIPNSDHAKVWTGIDGQFTEKLFLQALVGYGAATYDATSVPGAPADAGLGVTGSRRLLLTTQIRYDLRPGTAERPGTSVRTGYVRDFRDSFFTNWVGFDQLFVDVQARVGPVLPRLGYEVRLERYVGELTRDDTVHRLTLDVAQPFAEYATLVVGGWWNRRGSTDAVVEYDDFNLHLLATFRY